MGVFSFSVIIIKKVKLDEVPSVQTKNKKEKPSQTCCEKDFWAFHDNFFDSWKNNKIRTTTRILSICRQMSPQVDFLKSDYDIIEVLENFKNDPIEMQM